MAKKPQIFVTSQDMDRLEALLASLPADAFPGKETLQTELERAEVVEPAKIPPSVVTMNSIVHFTIEDSGKDFRLKLVYPKDINGNTDRISVLAPVGSALLGLAIGDELEWPGPGEGMIKVRVVDVIYQPERAGELYR